MNQKGNLIHFSKLFNSHSFGCQDSFESLLGPNQIHTLFSAFSKEMCDYFPIKHDAQSQIFVSTLYCGCNQVSGCNTQQPCKII